MGGGGGEEGVVRLCVICVCGEGLVLRGCNDKRSVLCAGDNSVLCVCITLSPAAIYPSCNGAFEGANVGVCVGVEVGLRSSTVGALFAVTKVNPPAFRAEVSRPVPTYFIRPTDALPTPAPCNTATVKRGLKRRFKR